VYLSVAVIVGSLILHFIINIDTEETYESFESVITEEHEIDFSYSKEEFIEAFYTFWQDCGYGEDDMSYRVYIRDGTRLTRSELTSHLEKINRGSELPRNSLLFLKTKLPILTEIQCFNGTISLGNNFSKVILYQDTSYISCFIDDEGYLQCDRPRGRIGTTTLTIGIYKGVELVDTEDIEITIAKYVEVNTEAIYITDSAPSTNFAGSDLITGGGRSRVLLKGNLPAIDPNLFIRAEILLDQNGGTINGQQLVAYAVSEDWDAGSATWSSFSSAGGSYYAEDFGDTYLTNSNMTASIEVTELVRTWILNPQINYGTILIAASEISDNQKILSNPRLALWYLE